MHQNILEDQTHQSTPQFKEMNQQFPMLQNPMEQSIDYSGRQSFGVPDATQRRKIDQPVTFLNQFINEFANYHFIVNQWNNNATLFDPLDLTVNTQLNNQYFKNQKQMINRYLNVIVKNPNTESTQRKREQSNHSFKQFKKESKKLPSENIINSQYTPISSNTSIKFYAPISTKSNNTKSSFRQQIVSIDKNSSKNNSSIQSRDNIIRLPKKHTCYVAEVKLKQKVPKQYTQFSGHYSVGQLQYYLNKDYMSYSDNQKYLRSKSTISNLNSASRRYYDVKIQSSIKTVQQQRQSHRSQSEDLQKKQEFSAQLAYSLFRQRQQFKKNDDGVILCLSEQM